MRLHNFQKAPWDFLKGLASQLIVPNQVFPSQHSLLTAASANPEPTKYEYLSILALSIG